MSNDIIKAPPRQLNISATGNGIAAGVVNGGITININDPETAKILLENFGASKIPESHAMEWAQLSHECFNLFVLENETYRNGVFSIGKRVALEKYTDREYQSRYKSLSPEAKAAIIQMPCIFAIRNNTFKTAEPPHPMAFGRVTNIECQRECIKFYIQTFDFHEQQIVNDHITEFGLKSARVRNQLDVEHWSIRAGNLQEIISKFGITIR